VTDPDPRGTGQIDVAGAAPTTTSTPTAPSRARSRIGLLLSVAVACAIGVGVYFWLREPADSDEFRPQIEALFTQLAAKDGAQSVYQDATAEEFKQTLVEDKFVDLVDRMNETLGPFVELTKITEVDRAASVAGMTARVRFEVAFEKADTTGEVSFLRHSKSPTWWLLGLGVAIPPELESKAAEVERELARVRAPQEVVDKVEQILQALRDGKVAEVRAEAADVFQTNQSVESLASLIETHRAELGEYEAVLAIISSAQNPDKDRATVHAILKYEKAKTTGLFNFMKVAGVWRMYGYKIVIPEPLLPDR
jgi:hypothetical protein